MKKLWIEFIQTAKKIKKDPKNVWWYVQGTYRILCYDYASFLIRGHILEQFEDRKIKAEECSKKDKCRFCGCKIPDLFFANKACSLSELTLRNRKLIYNQEDPCYGVMLSKQEWAAYKQAKVEKIKENNLKLKKK
jgi:hypothetical protein